MTKFNVGDQVFDLRYGFGKIVRSEGLGFYVRFIIKEQVIIVNYYLDGKVSTIDVYPSLLTLEQAAKLGYFPEKKNLKKTVDKWIILDPTSGSALDVYNEDPPNDWTLEDDGFGDCIVVKTTLEWEVEE